MITFCGDGCGGRRLSTFQVSWGLAGGVQMRKGSQRRGGDLLLALSSKCALITCVETMLIAGIFGSPDLVPS